MKKAYAITVTAVILLCCVLSCGEILQMYLHGSAAVVTPGESIFSREGFAAALGRIGWSYALAAIVLITGAVFHLQTKKKASAYEKPSEAKEPERKTLTAIRAALLLLSLLLIGWGIRNGGMRDVLIKAINICTECIGLG